MGFSFCLSALPCSDIDADRAVSLENKRNLLADDDEFEKVGLIDIRSAGYVVTCCEIR